MKALVSVDLRTEPADVVTRAAPWLAHLGAVADLVYVDPYREQLERYLPFSVRHELREMIAEDEAALGGLLDHLRVANRGRALVVPGRPGEEIARLAPEYDLIVASTHGRRGLSHLWLGSVAERITRMSPTSVLIVRNPPPAGTERILVPVALEEDGLRPPMSVVTRWAGRDARVDLLHVDEMVARDMPTTLPGLVGAKAAGIIVAEAERHRASVRETLTQARDEGLPAARRGEVEVDVGPAVTAILERADRYDRIIVGTHGRQGIARTVLGSVAERIVQRAPCTVLVVR